LFFLISAHALIKQLQYSAAESPNPDFACALAVENALKINPSFMLSLMGKRQTAVGRGRKMERKACAPLWLAAP